MNSPRLTDREFRALQQRVHALTGITINETKRLLLESRLLPRLMARGFTTFSEYEHLLASPAGLHEEAQALINSVTTNKTSFFREPHQFQALAREWVPWLARREHGARRLRAWSAACSTGAEPWTLAMVLHEQLPDPASWDAKILASDIDTEVLARAKEGLYADFELEGLDPARRQKHFEPVGGKWLVKDHLRRYVSFKRINFLDGDWPIRTQLELVLCRNASIYFDAPTQRRLFERLSQLLVPGGWLLVGHAEVLHGFGHVLHARPGGMYRRHQPNETPPAALTPVPAAARPPPARPSAPSAPAPAAAPEKPITVGELHAAATPTTITTLLGSCVAACLFDPLTRIGGMNHFLLPDDGGGAQHARFGIHAMETLINSLMKLGADRRRLVARLYGGANVLASTSRQSIGQRNAAFAKDYLEREKIPLVDAKLGGERGLHVSFESHTGQVRLREIARDQVDTRSEQAARNAPIASGDVELFVDV